MNSREKIEIIAYSSIVIGMSSLICFIAYKIDDANVSILSVFIPSIVALIYTAIIKGKNGVYELFIKQTIQKTDLKWLIISLFGIPVLATMAILTLLRFDISEFHLRSTQLMPEIVVIILIALGEEYGWRGFLLPRLIIKFNLFYSSVILGLIWGFWHLPAYLIGTGIPLQMNFTIFLLWVILGTLFINWIYYHTRSVLTSILAHISANAAFNYFFILPEFTGSMNTFWVFLAYLLILAIKVYASKRRR